MREKFYFENILKNCNIIDNVDLFLFFLVISYVFYKGVEYCYLIGIFFKIYEGVLKKFCCWEG